MMTNKAFLMVFVCFFISWVGMVNPAVCSAATGESQNGASIVQQISGTFQHNPFFYYLAKVQQKMNESIAHKIMELKQQNNADLLFSLMLASFLYGIFHALGPGHGKSVVSCWIISQQRGLADVLFIAVFGAVFHALSAAIIVGGTYVILGKFASVSTQSMNTYLQITAAIMVIGIGLVTIIKQLFSKHGRLSSHPQTTSLLKERPMLVALSIGIVPCPVTSVILIFCLLMGLIWQGFLLVVSFACGMGVSLVAVAFLVWKCKEKMIDHKWSAVEFIFNRILPVTGGILLILIGSMLLIGSI